MKIRNSALDQQAIRSFALKKVLTVADISEILSCSLITVRRRLKSWDACTSYNKNGRYYTLPSIPEFNKKGIWSYRDIYFSRYGTLKNTVIALAAKSKKGLNHTELQAIIGLNPKCFMARFKELPGIKKERYKNYIIYFSSDPKGYEAQKRNRFPPEPSAAKLPPDAQAIIILVELIRNPGISIEELLYRVHEKGYEIEASSVGSLLEHHNIPKKKLSTR